MRSCLENRRAGVVVESLESRRLFTAYLVDTSAALAAVNAKNLVAGDSVLLKGGTTISGSLVFDANDHGTAANPIIVSSYDPSTGQAISPTAASSSRGTLSAGNGDGIAVTNTAGINVIAINVVGSGRTVNTGSGIRFVNNLAGNVKLPHLRVDHVDVGGFRNFGINLVGAAGKSGFADVRFTYVAAHDNGQAGIVTQGAFNATSTAYAHTDVYVGYCTTFNNPGIAGFSSNSGNGVVLSDIDRGTVEYSQAYGNGALNTHDGGPVGIWAWDANAIVIQYNESHHNHTNSSSDGGGFDLDGGVTNSVIQYNYSHDNDGSGYGMYQFSGARPWHDNIVRFNRSVNDARKNGYGALGFWNGGSGLKNAEFYNNTVVIDSAGAAKQPWAVKFMSEKLTSIHLRNNNFVTQGTAGMLYAFSTRKDTDLLLQGNNYYAVNTFDIKWSKKSYSTMTAWRTGSGQERLANGTYVGLSVNPQFIDAQHQIASASPLAHSGLNLRSLFNINVGSVDLYGTVIPASPSTYSIGADWIT